MRKEIDKAVETFHRIAFGTGKNGRQIITDKQLASFVTVLTELLVIRYKNNWYPGNPTRGSGYRCLRLNSQCMDPTILESFIKSDISLNKELRSMELTIWVDPGVVSIRIGEEGSIGTEDVEMDQAPLSNSRKGSTSEDEAYSSRSPSPVVTRPTPKKNNQSVTQYNSSAYSTPRIHRGVVYHQNVSPPSMSTPPSASRPVGHPHYRRPIASSPSQELMANAGRIPSPSQYSRPKSLFSNQDIVNGNFQGYYKDGMMAVHQSHQAAMSMRGMNMNHGVMLHSGNYMDIPAQA